jgi:predicted dehydrogenase
MQKVRVAIIGAGNIAQTAHLPSLQEDPRVDIRAVFDVNKSKSKLVAQRFGISQVCLSAEELIGLDDIDAIHICTPTDTHRELAIAAMEAGKDVLIEKPVASSLAEAIDIHETAIRTERKAMIAMNHRFRQDVTLIKSYIEQGELGDIHYIKAGWLQSRVGETAFLKNADATGVGVMLDLGIVLVDLAMWMVNYRSLRSVRAVTQHNVTKKVEDFATALLSFDDGSALSLEAGWTLMRPEGFYYLNAFGNKGSAFLDPLKVIQRKDNTFVERNALLRGVSKSQIFLKSYKAEIQYFINTVRGAVPLRSGTQEAVQRMRVIEALRLSAAENREVSFHSEQ